MTGKAYMRSGQNTGILKALAAALLLHALVLLLPLSGPAPPVSDDAGAIELELVAYLPAPPVMETLPEHLETPQTAPAPLPDVDDNVAPAEPPRTEPTPSPVIAQQAEPEQVTDDSAAVILSRQFISEKSEAERLFGKPLVAEDPAAQREFRFPVRKGLLTMLDTPMPDLPFAYTPGLVHFAYDPGVRGDLQRFWDVITPEFGWRTDNGTEFRCVLILVIAGCGWK